MARAANQKLKILYILKLLEQSDEAHAVTMREILGELSDHGIQAERKRIYDDLDALRRFGYPIVAKRGRMAGYYLEPQAGEGLLKKGVWVQASEEAAGGEEASRAGKEEAAGAEDAPAAGTGCREAEGCTEPEWLRFGDTKVELCCEEEKAKEVLERLGGHIPAKQKAGRKPGSIVLKLKVNTGEAFYGWLAAFGCHVRLGGPPAAIKEYRKYLKEIRNMYKAE